MMWVKNWFSNFVILDRHILDKMGIWYNSVENFYQANKTMDRSERERFAQMLPSEAKREGRKLKLRPDWETVKLDVMYDALCQKFDMGTPWHQELMATGNDEIVEWNNWGDKYWGKDVITREGENHLGKLLMRLRDELREAK